MGAVKGSYLKEKILTFIKWFRKELDPKSTRKRRLNVRIQKEKERNLRQGRIRKGMSFKAKIEQGFRIE